MSAWQVRLGHQVTLYTANVDARPAEEWTDGYRVVRFRPIARPAGNAITPKLLVTLQREKSKFDIIHAHSHLYFTTNLCALTRRLGPPPLVITNHGLTSQTAPDWLQRLYTATAARWTLKAADRVICYTETEQARLEKLGVGGHKVRLIHNGIDTELFSPGRSPRDARSHHVLWVGRFVPGKKPDLLVDSFRILAAQSPDYRLTMVGKGPFRKTVKEQVERLGLGGRVQFKDFVPNPQLPELYREAGVFVLTSSAEGVPRAMLEAMSCGVPVVSTELGQLKEVVQDCGVLVPQGDPQAVADAIAGIANDRSLARNLGDNGRSRVMAGYSWKDTVERTVMVYEELL
jgi:glycosyltransferase involved in cell wall biosynthesis